MQHTPDVNLIIIQIYLYRVKRLSGEVTTKVGEPPTSKSPKKVIGGTAKAEKSNSSIENLKKDTAAEPAPKKRKSIGAKDMKQTAPTASIDAHKSDTDSDCEAKSQRHMSSVPAKGATFPTPRHFNPLDFVPSEQVALDLHAKPEPS